MSALDHDLAATLAALASLYRWDAHCSRDARSPMGQLVVPEYVADAGDVVAPPRLDGDGDGRDVDWTRAEALRGLVEATAEPARAILWTLCRECPQGTDTARCARTVAREHLRATGCPETGAAWRALEGAEARRIEAEDAAKSLCERVAVDYRNRVAISRAVAAEVKAARGRVKEARAAHAAALAAWDARGLALLRVALDAWHTAHFATRTRAA